MNIAEKLINNFDKELKQYFNPDSYDKWKIEYEKKLKTINHDEPWVSLIALYSIFGDQSDMENPNRIDAINYVLKNCGVLGLQLDSVDEIWVEHQMHEILSYRKYLRDKLDQEIFHLYPDRREIIDNKLKKENASFEGNTNLDIYISGKRNKKMKYIFIEAKFLSDISYQISYNPVRDQISRNIDAGIDFCDKKKIDYSDFYFLLLTPKIFRPEEFGDIKKSAINEFVPGRGRMYCYKMLDYKNHINLKESLPHRKLSDGKWKTMSSNIGWITFEDFYRAFDKYNSVNKSDDKNLINDFFIERNLNQK